MATFRKIIFWLHLCAGVFAGIVVLIMSVTGVALTYEKQMLQWADLRAYRTAPPGPGAPRLPMDLLLAKVQAERGQPPSTVTVRPGPADPVAFGFGRETTLFVNPYSGEILGEGSRGLRSFFRVMTDWHRWLGAGGERRNVGKAITGACNLAFLFIVVSGLYLWWPRNWRWQNVKSIVMFRDGLSGKARDFNWHNVIGFWSAVPLFFVVLSATVISYPWASNLVYRVAGEDPPERRGPGLGPGGPGRPAGPGGERGRPARLNDGRLPRDAGSAGPRGGLRAETPLPAPENPAPGPRTQQTSDAGEGNLVRANGAQAATDPAPAHVGTQQASLRPEGRQATSAGEESGRRSRRGGEEPGRAPAALTSANLDRLFARAGQQVPAWRTISLRMSPSGGESLSFLIDQGSGGQPHLRSTLVLDPQTAEVVEWETFSDATAGRRLRSWLRFIHTGEAGGLAGQTLAGLASAGAVFLVYTGLALTLRRFFAWARRKRRRAAA